MIEVKKYKLPDITLMENENRKDYQFFTWIPDKTYLVLGISNKFEKSLVIENVLADKVSVLKRNSGGEAVVLTPNTLVIATTVTTSGFQNPQFFFKKINQNLIELLSRFGITNLVFRGISDVAIGNKKIVGSSIYRKKNKLFYHAVLNVAEPVDTISKYIAHPSREPDYRKGRPHSDFVTSLNAEGNAVHIEKLQKFIANNSFKLPLA